jgi:hypothetical protein
MRITACIRGASSLTLRTIADKTERHSQDHTPQVKVRAAFRLRLEIVEEECTLEPDM